MAIRKTNKVLKHYGTPRRSGRYPWGSGDAGYQSTKGFLGEVYALEKAGLSAVDVAAAFGMNTRELRDTKAVAKAQIKAAEYAIADRLRTKGYSNMAIGDRLGKGEAYVRTLFDPEARARALQISNTANALQNAVDNKGLIDIGVGTECHLGIHQTKLRTAVAMLQQKGYVVETIEVPQVGNPGKYTKQKVLAPPGTTKGDIYKNKDKIQMVNEYSEDGGRTLLGLETPRSMSSDRIHVRYAGEGGELKDGLIELRPGVADISLGDKRYAQVRVAVDDGLYMKGMAMYSHDVPDGKDVIYNSTKERGTPANKVFKPMEKDLDNPFGSTVRQRHYIDADGNKQLSALNIVGYVEGGGEEGSWNTWRRNLSSQILSKQTPALAQRQLDLDFKLRKEKYDEIMELTNPEIKRKLLETLADESDKAAGHLKAAALPRQRHQVLLPFNSLKDNEIYAPNFVPGESVVLIRHPHGGIFEIPELRVNNKNPEAKRLIGDAADAVGINANVAKRLSGADFDGDTAIVIPNRNKEIKTSASIKALENFDPKSAYKGYAGMRVMTEDGKQQQMGAVSNLITDMTIAGASHNEIARAVRHSMVVIDAVNHELNYKQSAIDNNIAELKARYQEGGASTIISRSKAVARVPERKARQYVVDPVTGKSKKIYVDPATGEKLYTETGKRYTTKEGKTVERLTKSTRMAEEKDAHLLSSGTVMETVYADYANNLKSLANTARLSALNTTPITYNPAARVTFKDNVVKLKAELALVNRNKPIERKAQLAANAVVRAKLNANPGMSKKEIKRMKAQALTEARARYGSRPHKVKITDRDWLAIQSGALSTKALRDILNSTDMDLLKQRAMPKASVLMSSQRLVRARTMLTRGYTRQEVAAALGVSLSTLDRATGGEN